MQTITRRPLVSSPAVEHVVPGHHVGAARPDQEADALVEAAGRQRGGGRGGGGGALQLAGDGGRVRRTTTVALGLTGRLGAAVRVHAVHQAV